MGLRDRFKKRPRLKGLDAGERLDGKTVLVTGASSGLGFATSVELARLGARVIMACRSGIPDKGEEVKRLSGSDKVEMLYVDLSDLESINAFSRTFAGKGFKLDILISNAAIVPAQSRKSPQGLEEMFVVNFLAKFYLINKLIAQGAFNEFSDGWPRIIIVSSESHRNPPGFDWENFGKYQEYSMKDVVKRYGYFKLLLTTFAVELSRRLNTANGPGFPVRSLCPGPVNSNIAREAPGWAKPILKVVFGLFFSSPEKAAEPVIYYAATREDIATDFDYLFLMSRVDIDDLAADPANGERLWEDSEALLLSLGYDYNQL